MRELPGGGGRPVVLLESLLGLKEINEPNINQQEARHLHPWGTSSYAKVDQPTISRQTFSVTDTSEGAQNSFQKRERMMQLKKCQSFCSIQLWTKQFTLLV
ncbi:uncharacterized protein LOC122532505 [Frieseomelitta varia]|uniref:uncharacterized protein LOC122532505 n=1 Tax=Frieseomelitta varia TaxID=561572 RepID=UPI001CB68174|nr:uncharacterized protein LOC122532505 [Frieseomelitta varia]